MNKTAIKNFAVWARQKLREEIRTRAGFVGITESGIAKPLPASTSEIKYFEVGSAQPVSLTGEKLREREKLVRKLEKSAEEKDGGYNAVYGQMIENYAYDWFNRLIAIRFMEVNEYFPDNLRVLSATEEGSKDPDIVAMPFSSGLEFSDADCEKILDWKTKGKNDSLFRFLLLKRCNQLHECLPGLFEEAGDSSELMMHFSFVDKDGIIFHLVHDIEEEDWKEQIQIIGWIYQYYNSELKDETFALSKKGKKITKERIPSATQLFTPDWIVRYMVENSLGRIWLEGHPDNDLKAGWKYYLDEAEQEPEVQAQLEEIRKEYRKLTPEELTFIDPCMGSGHILVYAFDVLMQIYESQGYTKRDAVQSVLKNNLYGLDIDDRAYQLAYFSVMMKARQYDARILERGIAPQVYAIQESNGIKNGSIQDMGLGLSKEEYTEAIKQVYELIDEFRDAKEYGSIINISSFDWKLLRCFAVSNTAFDAQLSLDVHGDQEASKRIQEMIDIGEVLAKKYHSVVTNPPYLALSSASSKLYNKMKTDYPAGRNDLYSVFIERCNRFCKDNSFFSLITQHTWMFLSRSEALRKEVLTNDFISMAHLGTRAFEEIGGEVVQTTTFVIRNKNMKGYKSKFIRLVNFGSEQEKQRAYFDKTNWYKTTKETFFQIPGTMIIYWLSHTLLKNFKRQHIGEIIDARVGLDTGNNSKYIRLWHEVDIHKIIFHAHQAEDIIKPFKWVPHTKGGPYRKWYGNLEFILAFDYTSYSELLDSGNHLPSRKYYFKPGITWSRISTSNFAVRYSPEGIVFNSACPTAFANENVLKYSLGLLNSKIVSAYVTALSPTMNFQAGDIDKVPYIYDDNYADRIIHLVNENISISKMEWDSYETAWDFSKNPLVEHKNRIVDNYQKWEILCKQRFEKIKANEDELNRLFIDIYGLNNELEEEIPYEDITVRLAELKYGIRHLISYAVGCMFGRYSLDTPGLAYAGGEWDAGKYSSFVPDADNVIPITDARYLDDDIAEIFIKWLTVVYGEETLEENLSFIANVLGNKGTDSRDMIRNYFLKDFFKDHCAMYSVTGSGKRPIYWLFDSGKQNGFQALVYMHRYHAGTIGRVRASYLHRIQEKYENEVRAIDTMTLHMTDQRQIAAEEKRKEKLLKQVAEVKEYDEKLDHLAVERIEIDLDDGVKVNYEKIQTDRDGIKYQILAPIK